MGDENAEEVVAIDYDEPHTITLRHPISMGSQSIESLTLRPLTAEWLLAMDSKTGVAQILGYAQRMSGQTYQTINKLRGKDIGEVVRLVEGFIGHSLADGETSSED